MNFLLDTTAFSDLMREHPELDVRLETVSPVDRIIICSMWFEEKSYMVLDACQRVSGGRI